MPELWQRLFRPHVEKRHPQQVEAVGDINTYSLESFPKDVSHILAHNPIIELNAGDYPIAAAVAQNLPNRGVISQDIAHPQTQKVASWLRDSFGLQQIPDNFYYLIGNIRDFPKSIPSAIFSFFPLPQRATIDWLGEAIEMFAIQNPDLYALIVTENTSTGITARERQSFSLAEPLQEIFSNFDREVTSVSINFDSIVHTIPTLWCHRLSNMYRDATILEINPKRRGEFALIT